MAEVLISPGILSRENDQSQITQQPIQEGAALVGNTVKGNPFIPTIVTSYSDYASKFGTTYGSNQDTFPTSISAYNYFQNGGLSLLVTRVVTGSFSAASSSILLANTSTSFTIETLTQGDMMNNIGGTEISGSLPSGSVDNIRWEIVSPNTSKGTFSLIIRRGNDNTKNKSILETFNNLSLDPASNNYIEKVIGNQYWDYISGTVIPIGSYQNNSRYIRVKSVTTPTPNYFDNNGISQTSLTSSIPVAGSGAFAGGVGNVTSTGSDADFVTAFNLLANKDEYKFNLITCPEINYTNNTPPFATLISMVEGRGDALAIIDLAPSSSTISTVMGAASGIDSSYVASYWPFCQITNPENGKLQWVSPSTLIPGVFAYNDKVGEPWFAPAGINRGGLTLVRQTYTKLTQANRNDLYSNKVNPLATMQGRGVVALGQKTLQTRSSALDRINVRRLLITLKSYISQVADTLLFEQNTQALRNQFLSVANPYLESIQQRRGLYSFKVVMDETNNTADVIDRNELKGGIYLQPTKTSEFIYLDFNILPTGVSFE
jgi:hypothetical protein